MLLLIEGGFACLSADVQIPSCDPLELTSRRSYFRTAYGALAILPSATSKDEAKKAGRFLFLKPYSLNTLRRRQDLWFQFNHHWADGTAEPTHVGILVIKVVRTEHDVPTTVFRNRNWRRPGDSVALPELQRPLTLSWNEFTTELQRWASSRSDVKVSDAVIGGPWHAIPSGGTAFSWEYRRFWPLAVTNFARTVSMVTGSRFDTSKVSISAQLLRFTPTPVPQSASPVVFSVFGSDCSYLFVSLYSPSGGKGTDELSCWWWLSLRQ